MLEPFTSDVESKPLDGEYWTLEKWLAVDLRPTDLCSKFLWKQEEFGKCTFEEKNKRKSFHVIYVWR